MSTLLLPLFMYSNGRPEMLSGSVKTNMGFVLPALLFRAHPSSFTTVNLLWAQPAYLAGSPEAGEANGK